MNFCSRDLSKEKQTEAEAGEVLFDADLKLSKVQRLPFLPQSWKCGKGSLLFLRKLVVERAIFRFHDYGERWRKIMESGICKYKYMYIYLEPNGRPLFLEFDLLFYGSNHPKQGSFGF